MYKRYGEFRFRDYLSAWLAIAFLFALVVVGVLTETQFYLLIWPLLLLIIIAWSIFKPNSERFLISIDTITIVKGRKEHRVTIPSEITVVVSYADVCTPIAKHIGVGNQSYLLNGRYAISILKKMPIVIALERLHQKSIYKYTNSTIEALFGEQHYIFSCVGEQEILNKLLLNRNCQIIIPESLSKQTHIDLSQENAYIDVGY